MTEAVRRSRRRSQAAIEENSPSPVVVRQGYGKQALAISCILTLAAAWYLFSSKVIPLEIARVSELVFEGALLQRLPISNFLNDDFLKNLTSIISPFSLADNILSKDPSYLVGQELALSGAKAKHPLLMIPGVINSSLELWEGRACAKKYFRQKFWGSLSMLRIMLLDKDCWIEHMKMDPIDEHTLDPEGIRVRASQGLESSDFLFPGFWVWGKLIQNLADLGYDHHNMAMAPYDWRVDMHMLETRDGYFTRLKSVIEQMKAVNKQKVVVAAHSLGAVVWLYFMQWVEQDPATSIPQGFGGEGGSKWIEEHIHAFVDIAGPKLGVPKTLSCVMSGEMKDTVQMGKLESYVIEKLLSKRERTGMFRSWTGPLGMQIKGPRIWDSSCDRLDAHPLIQFSDESCGFDQSYSFETSDKLFEAFLPKPISKRLSSIYSNRFPDSYSQLKSNKPISSKWINPLEVPLPEAPSCTFYSFYGVGKPTERSFVYKTNENGCSESANGVPFVISTSSEDKAKGLEHGIYHADGDGTVPLISNGLMSYLFWKKPEYNPSNARIVLKEFKHVPASSVSEFRGGPKTADHVDIMGNVEMMADLIKILTGFNAEEVQDRIVSNITKISECLNL